MDDRTDHGQEREQGHVARRVAVPVRLHRSGEGMASVIEHLRRQLRERRGDVDREDSSPEPDDTRPPAG